MLFVHEAPEPSSHGPGVVQSACVVQAIGASGGASTAASVGASVFASVAASWTTGASTAWRNFTGSTPQLATARSRVAMIVVVRI